MLKLKATTIIETIVAVLIITLCFEIGAVFLVRVHHSFQSVNKLNAFFLSDRELKNVNNEVFKDGVKNYDGFSVWKKVSDYKGLENLKQVNVDVKTKSGIELINRKRIYYESEE